MRDALAADLDLLRTQFKESQRRIADLEAAKTRIEEQLQAVRDEQADFGARLNAMADSLPDV